MVGATHRSWVTAWALNGFDGDRAWLVRVVGCLRARSFLKRAGSARC